MQKDSDRRDKLFIKSLISYLVDLIVIFSLGALIFNIFTEASVFFEIIVTTYIVLITVGNLVILLAIVFMFLYNIGINLLTGSYGHIFENYQRYKAQGMEDYDVNQLLKQIADFDIDEKHVSDLQKIDRILSSNIKVIMRLIGTVAIAVLAFKLGLIYLFIMEVVYLIFIQLLSKLNSSILSKNLKIMEMQEELSNKNL